LCTRILAQVKQDKLYFYGSGASCFTAIARDAPIG
jgi:hypothetical protein